MKNNQRLTLADFKLSRLDSKQEIDKLLGGAAATCHKTCTPDSNPEYSSWIDWVDYEADKVYPVDISADQYKLMTSDGYDPDKDPFIDKISQ